MITPRSTSRFAFAGGLVLVIALLAALTLRVGGNHKGLRHFADARADPATARLEWLVDPTGRMSATDTSQRPAAEWHAWDGKHYLTAQRGEALWLRITLQNAGTRPLRAVLQETDYYMDRVEAWIVSPALGATERAHAPSWQPLAAGEDPRAGESPGWALRAAFGVDVPAGQTRVAYVRVEDYYFPFTWWQWWPRMDDYAAAEFRELLVKALCFGALTAMWLYNAVLWLRLRLADVGYYVGYAAAMTGFNFLENGGLALIGDVVASPWRPALEVVALALAAWCILRFARLFLDTAHRMPRLDRALHRLGFAWVAVFFGVFTMPWTSLTLWLAIGVLGISATHLLLLGGAVAAWRSGLWSARFFILAFGALCLGAVPGSLVWGSGTNTHPATLWLLAGSTLEMLLLSFAVADRFAQTQRKLVEETEQRRAIEEAYADELEVEVRERTRELAAANADKDRMLTLLGHDLRSPLASLTQTAEQLRGGGSRPPMPHGAADGLRAFVSDVGATGRQMLLLIEDIVLWSRLRVGAAPARAGHEAALVVDSAVRLHRAFAERRGVHITLDIPEGLAVQTDLVLAQALVRNLIGNAVKFARGRVAVRAEPTSDGVRLTVSDDGPGLPADVLARLRGKPAGEERGFGLRLCVEIATTLGVKLETARADERGTEISLTLPTAESAGLVSSNR